jgi:hypothetical protein
MGMNHEKGHCGIGHDPKPLKHKKRNAVNNSTSKLPAISIALAPSFSKMFNRNTSSLPGRCGKEDGKDID